MGKKAHFILEKFAHADVVLFAILVGCIFSLRWMVPLVIQENNPNSYSYVPIRYGLNAFGDDYYYYSHIQEVLSGHPLSHNPSTYENKDKATLHISYALSFLFCSIGGIFTGKIEHAYYFNLFVYPALNFFSLFWLCWLFLRNKPFALLLASTVTLNSPELARTPDILFTALPLTLLVAVLFRVIEERNQSLFQDLYLSAIMAVSPLISIPNLFLSYNIVAGMICVYWRSRTIRNRLIYNLCFSLIGLVFCLAKIYQGLRIRGEILPYFMPPVWKYSTFVFIEFSRDLFKLSLPLALVVFFKFRNQRFIGALFLGLILSFVTMSIAHGSFFATYVYSRGGELILKTAFLCGVYLIMETFFLSYWKRPVTKTIASMFAFIGVFFFLGYHAHDKFNESKRALPLYHDPSFKLLYQWMEKSSTREDVFVTLDFDLLTNLIVYAPADEYIPQVVLSPVVAGERNTRLYETCRFYGLTAEDFRAFLSSMTNHNLIDPMKVQQGLMQLVLFYGLYYDKPMPEELKDQMMADYVKILADPTRDFRFRSTLWIISRYDQPFVKAGSKAAQILRQERPLFKDATYAVYSLKH